jgi:hypothetical protein
MVFDPLSRYANLPTYARIDHRGRLVMVVPVPAPPNDQLLGIHVLREGERVDHLAFRYLENPAGFWRISEMNGVMLVEAITEKPQISIPAGGVR